MKIKKILFALLAMLTLVACDENEQDYPLSTNPANLLKTADQKATVATLCNVCDGKLYKVDYKADYMLNDVLADNLAGSTPSLVQFIFSQLLSQPSQAINARIDAGCSAFCVRSPEGDVLCGRNFDYRFPSSANVLMDNVPVTKGDHRSLAIASMPFLDVNTYHAGSLSDGVTDVSVVAAVPYLCMDGMNDQGLFICVLSLKGAGGAIQNDSTKTDINSSVAIRKVLDRCSTVDEAIMAFDQHNFCSDGRVNSESNFHFLVADATGNAKVLEYTHPEGSDEWVMNILNEDHVTNFYLTKGWTQIGVGRDRYDKLHDKLNEKNRVMTETECMQLLDAVHSNLNPEELTSNTQWSVVYNLTKRTATICVDKDYTRQFHFAL